MSARSTSVRRRRQALLGLAAVACGVASLLGVARFAPGLVRGVGAPIGLVGVAVVVGLARRRELRARRDRDALERLQLLRDRTCLANVRLVTVIGTEWVTQAGQAAAVVDVSNGHTGCQWFPLACFPPGSLVLVRDDANSPQLLDWMPPDEVRAAHRHGARLARSQHRLRTTRSACRQRHRQLMAEVEAALRNAGGSARGSPTRALPVAKRPMDHRHGRGTS